MYQTLRELVLASSSQRRRELLSRVGIRFNVIPSNLEEEGIISVEKQKPEIYVQKCAERKVEKVVELVGGDKEIWFLGVDTIVVIDDLILGKPKNREQAEGFLKRLSGKWHQVISGYHLYHYPGGDKVFNMVKSKVWIRRLSQEEINAYIKTDEPYDKAGGYAVQGIGAGLISEIQGSYTNVVGLPLAELLVDLLRLKVIAPME